MAFKIVIVNLFGISTIIFAALIGIFISRLKWVLVAATTVAVLANLALHATATMIFGSGAPGFTPFSNPFLYAIDLGSTLIAFLFWASAFFLLKRFAIHLRRHYGRRAD
jgi:hypothetical protein